MRRRRKGEEAFNYKLKCPYCKEEQESSIVFNKRPYRLRCSNCGKSILREDFFKITIDCFTNGIPHLLIPDKFTPFHTSTYFA